MSGGFLVKAVAHDRGLKVHAADPATGRPRCVAWLPKFRGITAWQTDPGPVTCGCCRKILEIHNRPKS